MVKQGIQIFARVKPTKKPTADFNLDCDEQGASLNFVLPRDLADGFVNNKREHFKFRFQKVFGPNASQEEVFEDIAKPVAENAIIYTTHISYLEIYNEAGYDLLNPQHEASRLEDLPRVSIMEDPDQNIHLKNLSLQQSANEEEALNLLFLGDTNRMIAETPMNQASTRSHCIFTIHLRSKEVGSATVRCSKLHLVDLAGSERVGKSGVGGQILTEAKYINLSLHYLEQVIIALSEKDRSHIPYRNSMMTSVLRDSLGGNCMTTMISTVSVETRNVAESISTCRFAQRVALIKNDASLNEEVDPALVILRLKREIQILKEQLALVTGEQRSDELTPEELQLLEEQVNLYLDSSDCEVARVREKECPLNASAVGSSNGLEEEDRSSQADLQKLQEMLKHRDNEISILVNMLKREKKKLQDVTFQAAKNTLQTDEVIETDQSNASTPPQGSKTRTRVADLSTAQQEVFELFLRDHEDRPTIENNKAVLQERFIEAKKLGEQVNQNRIKVNELKMQLKKRRKQIAAQGIMENKMEPEPDPLEEKILNQIEDEKKIYKMSSSRLKELKTQIEHLQHLHEKMKFLKQQHTDILPHDHRGENTGDAQNHQMFTRRMSLTDEAADRQERRPREHYSLSSKDQRAILSPEHSSSSIPLTGDKQTDADIQAFIRARHSLLNSSGRVPDH
ncbi:hypothetical protein DNTS_030478 [Danionella cerebrum]|uniref:Kinesin-like protein n=1 Tax=Danionella cerebrum TaxID=2873325 RepID=A0A553MM05_9TELE|nr:hypothetical protein DNTS_030478 [Danionella translucida]